MKRAKFISVLLSASMVLTTQGVPVLAASSGDYEVLEAEETVLEETEDEESTEESTGDIVEESEEEESLDSSAAPGGGDDNGGPDNGGPDSGSSDVSYSAATTYSSDGEYSGQTYTSSTGEENALLVTDGTVTIDSSTFTKTGSPSGRSDNYDWYGTNAAAIATGGTLTITDSTVETEASYGNGIFSCGATVNVSDTEITTKSNNSGGIMTTMGGTMNATNLTVNTAGGSSAAIRSDKGGGDVNVTGGTFTTTGQGSPSIYSTADIEVTSASLKTSKSEAVVIEGANSVTLNDCTVVGNNTTMNGQATTYHNVMLYQSQSGDASTGTATFNMTGGSMTAQNGHMFHVTNTTAVINLDGVSLTNSSDDYDFLNITADSWGSSGSNGGDVTFTATDQEFEGSITVDDVSSLNMTLDGSSVYTGSINSDGTEGTVKVTVASGTP